MAELHRGPMLHIGVTGQQQQEPRNAEYLRSDVIDVTCRSRWPRGLRRESEGVRLLRLRVRIPPGAGMSVCSECCVLSGRGLFDGLITRAEQSYRVWCV
jgi:hypothetical protein